jgi:hypothetical protein
VAGHVCVASILKKPTATTNIDQPWTNDHKPRIKQPNKTRTTHRNRMTFDAPNLILLHTRGKGFELAVGMLSIIELKQIWQC